MAQDRSAPLEPDLDDDLLEEEASDEAGGDELTGSESGGAGPVAVPEADLADVLEQLRVVPDEDELYPHDEG